MILNEMTVCDEMNIGPFEMCDGHYICHYKRRCAPKFIESHTHTPKRILVHAYDQPQRRSITQIMLMIVHKTAVAFHFNRYDLCQLDEHLIYIYAVYMVIGVSNISRMHNLTNVECTLYFS